MGGITYQPPELSAYRSDTVTKKTEQFDLEQQMYRQPFSVPLGSTPYPQSSLPSSSTHNNWITSSGNVSPPPPDGQFNHFNQFAAQSGQSHNSFNHPTNQFNDWRQVGSSFTNPITQMGLQRASDFVHIVNDSYISRVMGSLRYYFSVNNSYVLNKLRLLIFPFIHKAWSRRIIPATDQEMYLPPNLDLNAPDLYIPSMAFISYILISALYVGMSRFHFNPEILGRTATSGLMTLFIEVTLIKIAFYLLSYPSIAFLDLICYCGYKFVNLAILMAASCIHRIALYILFIYLFICIAVFMIKTLRLVVPQPHDTMSRTIRTYLLFSIALSQGFLSFLLYFFFNAK